MVGRWSIPLGGMDPLRSGLTKFHVNEQYLQNVPWGTYDDIGTVMQGVLEVP